MSRHPTTATWQFPSARDPLDLPRTNLRELMARPTRFEHHLLVVGRVGDAQIEVVCASEPLYFAHANISDEYALQLPTGDALIDGFPVRTFIADGDSGEDVGRIRHRQGQLVLHPHGLLHWTGRLRPPFEMPPFPGARRTGLSLVFCSATPIAPKDRPLLVTEGLEDEVKAYTDLDVPFVLADLAKEEPGVLAVVGNARIELLRSPSLVGSESGGYLVVLEAAAPWFATDMVFVAPGAQLDGEGIDRALWLTADVAAQPPPDSWDAVPEEPFACFEAGARGALPLTLHGVHAEAVDGRLVKIAIGDASSDVPRHWLTRMLYRLALHGYALGYLETYGGFFYDDRDGYRLGVRGGGEARLERAAMEEVVEVLYRAVAPDGYIERAC
jgi:hypothetical protein